jgi:hypothetical protein
MATPSPAVRTSSAPVRKVSLADRVKPYLVPYYLTIAAVIGALTAGFIVVIVLLIMVVANFNALGFVE